MTQTELEHLTVKSTLYKSKTYPWGPSFGPFCSTASGFQDIAHVIIPKLTTGTLLSGQKQNKTIC